MRRAHRRSHFRIWIGLAVLLPAILLVAMVARQDGPREAPAVRLSPPGAAP
jgi:cytochrome oxidase assembly protein ShyY1